MEFFIENDLAPSGAKSYPDFWRMVERALKINTRLHLFVMNCFLRQTDIVTNRVILYKSPFRTWDELFVAYNKIEQ